MKKILAVARWEYLEKVKSKAFLIGLLVTPIIMLAMGILPSVLATTEDTTTKVIGILDFSGRVAGNFSQIMESSYRLSNHHPNYAVRILPAEGAARESLLVQANRLAVSGEIDGYVLVNADLSRDSIMVDYRSKTVGDVVLLPRLERTVRQVIAEDRAAQIGLSPAVSKRLAVDVSLNPTKLSEKGEQENAGFQEVFFTSFGFMMMMFFLIMISGQLLVRSVIEEKANRIVEVLVSSCSPTDLMAGKVLGLSGLGFTQLAFWGVIGLGVTLQTHFMLVDLVQALLLVIYFILGYLFYSAVFIGVGSPLNTEQEAQQVNSYLVLLLIVPIMLALPAMRNPDAMWIKILTFVPFFTPTMMALRIPIQTPPLWEVVVTIVLMLGAIAGTMVVAGRIFRIGILSMGKTPNLKEILRWVRTG